MALTLEQPIQSSVTTFSATPVEREIPITAVIVLVVWLGCVAVGLMGYVLPYARPVAPPKPQLPLQAEVLQVELTNDPLPPLSPELEGSAPQPPALPQVPAAVMNVPSMTAVAEPSAVAFALPVEGPVTVVEPVRASYAAAPVPVEQPAPPAVLTIVYGQGEGRQPAPEYPLRARREGQEGVVGIRFGVGENGRVLSAEATRPCAWKLLNDAAVRVVLERWRFPTGAIRFYEVSIRFQLTE